MAPGGTDLHQRLLATFRGEAEERLTAMSAALRALDGKPEAEPRAAAIEAVFRAAHSLKGAAGAVDLGGIERLCGALEDVLASLKAGRIHTSPTLLELLQRCVDAIAAMSIADAPAPPDLALLRELGAALERDSTTDRVEGLAAAPQRPAPPAPAASPSATVEGAATPATVRVSSSNLDRVVRQVEELLEPRLALARRSDEVRQLGKSVAEHAARFRSVQPLLPQFASWAAAGTPERRGIESMLDFFAAERAHLELISVNVTRLERSIETDRRQLESMVGALTEDVLEMQLLPCSTLLDSFRRLVRALAREQAKDVDLVIEGSELQVDRRLLEALRDPLTHMLRNAVVHGVELPDARSTRGKPPRGTITVAVAQPRGGMIELRVHDDGAGIDIERVRAAAVDLTSAGAAEQAGGLSGYELVFESGLTTSAGVSSHSGRGLGLAITRDAIERLGGSIALSSEPGVGTTFSIVLPVTVATFRAVIVRVGTQVFVLPMGSVARVVRVPAEDVRVVANGEMVMVDDGAWPLERLDGVLGIEREEVRQQGALFRWFVVLGPALRQVAFEVDEVVGDQEVLVKPLGPQLVRVRHVAGATVLGDGAVVPVLDVQDLLNSVGTQPPARVAPTPRAGRGSRSLLVVEDSITSRSLLKGILESAGYRVHTAVDGEDALDVLETHPIDAVVSDVDMPRMDGIELTARLRTDARFARLPVVLVTSLDAPADRRRGEEAGANAYLAKRAFDRDNLLDVVRELT